MLPQLRSLVERIGVRTFDPENGDPALLSRALDELFGGGTGRRLEYA